MKKLITFDYKGNKQIEKSECFYKPIRNGICVYAYGSVSISNKNRIYIYTHVVYCDKKDIELVEFIDNPTGSAFMACVKAMKKFIENIN